MDTPELRPEVPENLTHHKVREGVFAVLFALMFPILIGVLWVQYSSLQNISRQNAQQLSTLTGSLESEKQTLLVQLQAIQDQIKQGSENTRQLETQVDGIQQDQRHDEHLLTIIETRCGARCRESSDSGD